MSGPATIVIALIFLFRLVTSPFAVGSEPREVTRLCGTLFRTTTKSILRLNHRQKNEESVILAGLGGAQAVLYAGSKVCLDGRWKVGTGSKVSIFKVQKLVPQLRATSSDN